MYNYLIYQDSTELDKLLLPAVLYNAVLNRRKVFITKYLEKHPKLALKILQFNQTLKMANSYNAQNKCGCPYTIPWFTQYQKTNNKKLVISFNQQVDMYRYMIRYWYPSTSISNMRYLSNIALQLLLNISMAWYYISNNLQPCIQNSLKVYKINNVYQFMNLVRNFI